MEMTFWLVGPMIGLLGSGSSSVWENSDFIGWIFGGEDRDNNGDSENVLDFTFNNKIIKKLKNFWIKSLKDYQDKIGFSN
jgi:hypothetical protein